MVLWAMLEVSRFVANNRRVCSEAVIVKVLMGYKLLLASYVGSSSLVVVVRPLVRVVLAALCWSFIVYGLSGSLILGLG